MDKFVLVAIVALIVQFLTDRVKGFIPESATAWAVPLLALLFGELICVTGQIDVLSAAGVVLAPAILGHILTGIAVTGGATAVNELIKLIREARVSKSE